MKVIVEIIKNDVSYSVMKEIPDWSTSASDIAGAAYENAIDLVENSPDLTISLR